MSMGISVGSPAEYGMTPEEYWKIRNIFDTQSIALACEILPSLYELYPQGNHRLTLLDVGARTGAGTGLIGYLHQQYAFNRIKIEATAIDLDSKYVTYAKAHYRYANYIVSDITTPDFTSKYNIVLSSHTVEHVEDPDRFVEALRTAATDYTIVACPLNEKVRIPGHRNTIDLSFFQRHDPISIKSYNSTAWTGSEACIAILRPIGEQS